MAADLKAKYVVSFFTIFWIFPFSIHKSALPSNLLSGSMTLPFLIIFTILTPF